MSINLFTIKDAHEVMNTLARQATGDKSIDVIDSESFVDAGTATLESGYENVIQSLAVLIGKTIIDVRKYKGKFGLISAESNDAFENRLRKIYFYSRDNIATGMYNTDIYTNLGTGLDDGDGVGSQYEQFAPLVAERYFSSNFAWDYAKSDYPEQMKIAFTNEGDFIAFVNGVITEVENDLERTLEAKNRLVALDRIAGTKLMVDKGFLGAECSVNLLKAYNDEYGTSYTVAELLKEHTTSFIQFFTARIKLDSDRLTNSTALYHDPMTKTIDGVTYNVLMHTPKEKQKFLYYSPLFTQLNTEMALIFNPEYIKLPNGEGVEAWQSFTSPSAIDVTPALPNGETSEEVKIDFVVGMLFDSDGCMTNNRFKSAYTTPLNARHVYTTTYWHNNFGVIQDYVHPSIVYYLEDEEPEPEIQTDTFEGDGTTTDFELTKTASETPTVTIDGEATTDFTFADNTISFTTAPEDDAEIVAVYTVEPEIL